MPDNFSKFSLKQCDDIIKALLSYSETQGIEKQTTLNDLVLYYMGYQSPHSLMLKESGQQSVLMAQKMCLSKHQFTRSNFLQALTALCYEYALPEPIEFLSLKDWHAAKIIATFYHQTTEKPLQPIRLTATLDAISQLPTDKKIILLFCIRVFSPEITFEKSELGRMKEEEMTLFLNKVRKSYQLILDDTRLDQWDKHNWSAFYEAVEQNKSLTSLSLNKTSLYLCCLNEEIFQYILNLIALPHLSELFLHNNLLNTLPPELFTKLRGAIDKSPIKHIGLRHVSPEDQGLASSCGMFARYIQRSVDFESGFDGSLTQLSDDASESVASCSV
ncbi:leucine-rich repeat domain-containing protein [Legionella worsleiensis]|uniref:Leucine-rich repeat-containing protein n=1 Tax=Legionella worsleiensis TaxID=45076 RepID=A0A0W1AFR9_9GAMM|nr:leucine-rich repeat domain-containing protein [Legionella worsleiensis]KTD80215.1 hypothetical protein Lwor_1123 [Legionella worsleiensis]STY31720.1 Uncharacterised protein [Legionella worsleiensis]